MRSFLAEIFRVLFKSNFLKKRHYGIHKRIFAPLRLFRGVIKTNDYKGLLLELHIDDWIQENIYFLGDYEEPEQIALKRFLRSGDVFIDVGANCGLYSLTISKLVKEKGTIISFEPFSQNYTALKKNISLNNIVNIRTEKMAVGESDGTIDLYYDTSESNLGMVSTHHLEKGIKEQVKIVSLDSYLTISPIQKVDVIKIDIEGHEYQALLGMRNLLLKKAPVLFIEVLDINREKVDCFLTDLGYKKHFIDDLGNLIASESNPSRNNYIYTRENF